MFCAHFKIESLSVSFARCAAETQPQKTLAGEDETTPPSLSCGHRRLFTQKILTRAHRRLCQEQTEDSHKSRSLSATIPANTRAPSHLLDTNLAMQSSGLFLRVRTHTDMCTALDVGDGIS